MGDSAQTESYSHMLKVDLVMHCNYRARGQARAKLFDYMDLGTNSQAGSKPPPPTFHAMIKSQHTVYFYVYKYYMLWFKIINERSYEASEVQGIAIPTKQKLRGNNGS
jgi:hypothetical protein